MSIAQNEIFGPVLAQIDFDNFNEVVSQANQTFYGLAASIWTQDLNRAHQAAKALKVGTVWVNHFGAFDHAMPFGGYKMSGFFREGGRSTFDFYTQLKSIWIHLE